MVKYFLSKGADVNLPNNFGATPFWGTCAMGEVEIVNLLIEHGANINYKGRFPDLLEKTDRRMVTGITALMIAAKNNDIEMIKLLLKHNADMTLADSLGRKADDYTTNPKIKKLLQN